MTSDSSVFASPGMDNTPVPRKPLADLAMAYLATKGDAIPLTTFPDLMIDIEALADTPDSAPAQIALVFFDRDARGSSFRKYAFEPSPMSAIRLGFIVTTATLLWWDDQGMAINVQRGQPITEVLDEISTLIQRHRGTGSLRVWSRGNSYDLAILKLAYQRTRKKVPWDFWRERDVRTWLECLRFKSSRKNNHNALDDAVNQAADIIEATQTIAYTVKAELN